MAAIVNRACVCTREEVKRALDVKQAAYANARIDRAIISATESVEQLTQRVFYIWDDTRYKDWPNFDYSYPWRVWLDQDELADVTVNIPVVNSGGVIIPNSGIFWGDPTNPHPPFKYLELNRALSNSFGNGPTPQREIAITGTYGYWRNTNPAGILGAAVLLADQTITVSEGDTPGVGDLVLIESERMVVTDAVYANTTFTISSGCTTASAADNNLIPSGGTFIIGETLQIGTEWMLVQGQSATGYIMKRAYDGSVLTTHSGGDQIWARRLLSVLRGQYGTTAAAHNNSLAISTLAVPGMIKDLGIAEALVTLGVEVTGYAVERSSGSTRSRSVSAAVMTESNPGTGIDDLRDRVMNSKYSRKARSRVI